MAAILSKPDIQRLLQQEPPLIEDYINLEEQVQPNGIDLTLREVSMLQSSGQIAVKNSQRLVSDVAPLVFDGLNFVDLMPGTYIITYNEIVHLPKDVMALATPRSSLPWLRRSRRFMVSLCSSFTSSGIPNAARRRR